MEVSQEIKYLANGIQNREHSWESPSQETPQERKEEETSAYDKPIEYTRVFVIRRKK